MYDDTYEDYIRNILGYNNYDMYTNTSNTGEYNMDFIQSNYNRNDNLMLESYYPEIYKIVYPMVKKICMENARELTKDRIEEMTEEIYMAIESNENREEIEIAKADTEVVNQREKQKENRIEERRIGNNRWIRDLIKILILRELLGNQRPPIRPPRPNHRPPFRPGFYLGNSGNRPPMPPRPNQPRNQFDSIYEEF